jgi:hypothetical protein
MGNGNSRSVSNVVNDSRTECDGEGNCERVATSCVDGECTETRTPIDSDETDEGGDDGADETDEGGDDGADETDEEGDDDIEMETVVEQKTYPIRMIVFFVIFCIICIIVAGIGIIYFKKKIQIPKNPNLNKV